MRSVSKYSTRQYKETTQRLQATAQSACNQFTQNHPTCMMSCEENHLLSLSLLIGLGQSFEPSEKIPIAQFHLLFQ